MPKKSDINIHINDGDAMLFRRQKIQKAQTALSKAYKMPTT